VSAEVQILNLTAPNSEEVDMEIFEALVSSTPALVIAVSTGAVALSREAREWVKLMRAGKPPRPAP
jgi:hypothetical protein